MKTALLFIDGLGVGKDDWTTNPCCRDRSGIFQIFQNDSLFSVPFSGVAKGLDANLGISGLPQSATGQTTLLTGINAAQKIGRHLSGFPNQPLREILVQHSVFRQIVRLNRSAAFLNAFRPIFFELPEEMILRLSATTIANYAANLPFFRIEDIRARRSIYQDFTNVALLERGFEVPIFTPEEAAEILTRAVEHYDFILYEYFLTDRAGHSQNMQLAEEEIHKLGRFVSHFLNGLDLGSTTVILSSDHGNLEDLSTKSHTRNPAMTILWGPENQTLIKQMRSIADIVPLVYQQLQNFAD